MSRGGFGGLRLIGIEKHDTVDGRIHKILKKVRQSIMGEMWMGIWFFPLLGCSMDFEIAALK
jgi:hypothetical protein